MPNVIVSNFLHSLATWIVARAAAQVPATVIAYGNPSAPNGLWLNEAIEPTPNGQLANAAADPYSVLRVYGGDKPGYDPVPRRSIQVFTTAKSTAAAMDRANVIYEALLQQPSDPQPGLPLRMQVISGYKLADNSADNHWQIKSVDPIAPPAQVGIDSRSRLMVTFNFDVGFCQLSS